MRGGREVDRVAKKYVSSELWCWPVVQLLIGVWFLIAWTFAFGFAVDEGTATSRAARSDGVPGTFTVQSQSCPKGRCVWTGTFTTGSVFQLTREGVELRGDGGHSLDFGDVVPALDVGSGRFVHLEGGSPEWWPAVGAGIVTAVSGSFGAALIGGVVRHVNRTRPSRAARRRAAAVGRRGSALGALAERDRWSWLARPRSSAVRVKMRRSIGRTLGGTVGLLLLIATLPLFGLIWVKFNKETTAAELVAGLWAPPFAVVLVGVAIQTFRLVAVRPRLWATDEEIVIRDGLLLWKLLRIPRTAIAAIHYGDESGRGPIEEGVAQLTPFPEELNLTLRMRDGVSLPARRLRWGNWFWWALALQGLELGTGIPQRGRPVRWLRMRVKEPRRVAADLDRWLTEGAHLALKVSAPVDHAHYGKVITHRGVGGMRVKIKGPLPQPVLAEFTNEGPGELRAWLRRTEFGEGTPVAVCGPGASTVMTVLSDRSISGKPLTKRFLSVESEGRWTVTISGPDRARKFTASATGSGTEVLSYQGPPGIGVVTCPSGEAHQVHLYGPDLVALEGCDPVASTDAHGPLPSGESPPNRSAFAIPAHALIQVRTASEADWRIDVTPLEEADLDDVPPTGRVRPFEHSIAGDRTAVVRYLGPPGPVLFLSGETFGLVRLDATLTPVQTLALPYGETEIQLHSHSLLQVTGGEGAWSLEEIHTLVED